MRGQRCVSPPVNSVSITWVLINISVIIIITIIIIIIIIIVVVVVVIIIIVSGWFCEVGGCGKEEIVRRFLPTGIWRACSEIIGGNNLGSCRRNSPIAGF